MNGTASSVDAAWFERGGGGRPRFALVERGDLQQLPLPRLLDLETRTERAEGQGGRAGHCWVVVPHARFLPLVLDLSHRIL